MAILLILSQLVILYVLVIMTRQLPLIFRLFLGLLITWPVLSLYISIDLPAGVPDIQYSRAFVGALLISILISATVAQRYRPSFAASRSSLEESSRLAGSVVAPSAAVGSAAVGSAPPAGDPVHESPGGRELSNVRRPVVARARRTQGRQAASPNAAHQAQTYQGQVTGIPMLVTAYVGLMAVSVISSLASGSVGSTVIAAYLDATLLPLAIYYFTRKYVDSRQRLVWLMAAITVSTLIICLTGIYENTLDLTHSPLPITPINEEGDTRWLGVPGGRAAGVLVNPAIYGSVMGMGMLCCAVFFVHSSRRSDQFLLGGVALILAYGVFVSYTRSAWVSVAIALLFAQFFLNGLWKVTMPLLLFGALVLGLTWGALQQSDLVQDRVLDKENVTGRIERTAWSWDRFVERPILGRGLGSLDDLMQNVFQEDFDTSHNTYLTMLVDVGVIRFALFAAVVLSWLAKAASVLRSGPRGRFEYSVVAAMVGFLMIWLLSGLSIELRLFPYFAALFWMAGALIERLNAHVVSSASCGERFRAPRPTSRRSRMTRHLGENGAQLYG